MTSNPFFVVKTRRSCSFFLTLSFAEIMPDFILSSTFLTFLLTLSLQPFRPGMFILSSTGMHRGCSAAAPLRLRRIQKKTNQLRWCRKLLSTQHVLTQMYLRNWQRHWCWQPKMFILRHLFRSDCYMNRWRAVSAAHLTALAARKVNLS